MKPIPNILDITFPDEEGAADLLVDMTPFTKKAEVVLRVDGLACTIFHGSVRICRGQTTVTAAGRLAKVREVQLSFPAERSDSTLPPIRVDRVSLARNT